MKLTKFRVENFRSIEASGEVDIAEITALVGRNESGKSNLLLALASLNPPGGLKPLNPVKDFPRSRKLQDCNDQTHVVWTWWTLEKDETEAIKELIDFELKTVAVGRGYGPKMWVDFLVKPAPHDPAKDATTLKRLKPVLSAKWKKFEEAHATAAATAWAELEAAGAQKDWAKATTAAAQKLRDTLGAAEYILTEKEDEMLREIEVEAERITNFATNSEKARETIRSWVPTFIYISDFPELAGHQNLDEFVNKRGQNPSLKEREDNFEKLAKVASFDPTTLNNIRNDHEQRGQLLNRAGNQVTAEIRRLWKDRPLLVRFNIDGPHLAILVSDPNSTYPVEVNLDERSRGFRWFFAFFISFSADTQGGDAEGAVLLLDEPGLYLHAKSQENLLQHLRTDYDNQIIYTTHSPFMVPKDAIESVRTVNIDEKKGTTVTNVPSGDSRTLFPLQAALGYSLSQTLFVGHSNLVVEGVTDFWILSSVNTYFQSEGKPALPEELTITPSGGAGKVPYMAALLVSEETNVVVLLDDDRAGRDAQKELVGNKLLRDTAVMFVTDGLNPKPTEADIEDLIDPAVYTTLVNDTYKAELKGKTLPLNAKIPRIVKRYEEAFEAVGLKFNKTRPAREFMSRMGKDPKSVLPAASAARFESIFNFVDAQYQKVKDKKPFS